MYDLVYILSALYLLSFDYRRKCFGPVSTQVISIIVIILSLLSTEESDYRHCLHGPTALNHLVKINGLVKSTRARPSISLFFIVVITRL